MQSKKVLLGQEEQEEAERERERERETMLTKVETLERIGKIDPGLANCIRDYLSVDKPKIQKAFRQLLRAVSNSRRELDE